MKIHLDPRTKLVISICLSSLALLYQTPGKLILLLLLVVALFIRWGVNLGKFLKPIKMFLPVLLVLILVQSVFSREGQVLVSAGGFSLLTAGGVIRGVTVGLRMLVIIGAAFLLMTCGTRDLVLGLMQMKLPYEIAFMVLVGLRFLPLLRDEARDTMVAMQLRGLDVKKVSFKNKVSIYASLFFPLVYSILLKSQQLSIAMEVRCFGAGPKRTNLRRLILRRQDVVLMVAFAAGTLGLMIGEIF